MLTSVTENDLARDDDDNDDNNDRSKNNSRSSLIRIFIRHLSQINTIYYRLEP